MWPHMIWSNKRIQKLSKSVLYLHLRLYAFYFDTLGFITSSSSSSSFSHVLSVLDGFVGFVGDLQSYFNFVFSTSEQISGGNTIPFTEMSYPGDSPSLWTSFSVYFAMYDTVQETILISVNFRLIIATEIYDVQLILFQTSSFVLWSVEGVLRVIL